VKPLAELPVIECFDLKVKKWVAIADTRQLEAGDVIRMWSTRGELIHNFNRPHVAVIKTAMSLRPLTQGEYDHLMRMTHTVPTPT
jgi:hypothetical protein